VRTWSIIAYVFFSVAFLVFTSLGHYFHPWFGFIRSLVCQFATCYREVILISFRKGIMALFFSCLLFDFLCGRGNIWPIVRK